jgi:hypothetical protein
MGEKGFMTVKEATKGFKNLRQNPTLPNEDQRGGLCELLHYAFVDIRAYAYEGKHLEAGELADIFHNIPDEMYGYGLWDLSALIQRLRVFHKKYGGTNYVSHLNRIFQINHRSLRIHTGIAVKPAATEV